ncbi:MAG: 2-isopropylmalate synthase [Planctomycetes bacterium]|nr:2-isopropylmalate synthase [Planctomycetota bacterium]
MAEANHDNLIYDWNLIESDEGHLRQVTFDDETLRDGLQNPSVYNPSIREKRELVRLMDKLGIHTVNVGLPGAGDRHYDDCLDLVRCMTEEGLAIKANTACRTLISDIEPVRRIMDETGARVLANCFIGSSPIRQYTEGWNIDTILGHIDKSLGWARDHQVPFALVTEDTTRSKPEDIARLYRHAIDLGAERIVVCDTCGHAMPHGTRELVRFVKSIVRETGKDVKIDWHGHRDRGMGTINCIVAVRAGADQVHGAAMGIGERAGNAAMDLILVNMKLMGWIDNDLHALDEYVHAAAKALRVEVPCNYPVFGNDAFLTGTGVHASAVIKALKKGDDWLADRVYSGVPAGEFGRRQEIGVGPMSGRSNVLYCLHELGYDTGNEALVEHIFAIAKASPLLMRKGEVKATAEAFLAGRQAEGPAGN